MLQDFRLSHNTVKHIKGKYTNKAAYGSTGYEFTQKGEFIKKRKKKQNTTLTEKSCTEDGKRLLVSPLCSIDYSKEEKNHPHFLASEPNTEQIEAFKSRNQKAKKEQKVGKERAYKLPKVKVRKKIMAWMGLKRSKKQVYFWTITFPEKMKDSLCYKYFNVWFTRCRKELNLKSYIWVAERQQNSTLHFHILFNQKINIVKANKFLRITLLNGRNKGEYKYDRAKILNYNGVDIAKQSSRCYNSKTGKVERKKGKKVLNFAQKNKKKALVQYLSKYVTKNDTIFSRLVWHCSRDVSNLFTELAITDIQFNMLKKYTVSEHGEMIEFENDWVVGWVLMREVREEFYRDIEVINNFLIDNYFEK